MNGQKILSFLVYLGIAVVCYACLKEFVRNLMIVHFDKKVKAGSKEAKFSRVTVVYIACLYALLLFRVLSFITGSSHLFDQLFDYFFTSIGIFGLGLMNLINAEFLYARGKVKEVKRIWITLKISMFPLGLLNVVYFVYTAKFSDDWFWFYFIALLLGMSLFPVMPFVLPCVLNFFNGCVGWNYIRYLRERCEGEKCPSKIHYVLQAFPVLDLISMALILKRYRGGMEKTTRTVMPFSRDE